MANKRLVRRSESKGGEASDEGHEGNLDEGGSAALVVREGEIDVGELGAIGVELKLSGGILRDLFVGLRITVLNTGDADPEVSNLTLASSPLRVINTGLEGGRWIEVLILISCLGGKAASGIGHLVKVPNVKLVSRLNTVH